jgi:mannan endo-1,4-beta-mannosidase
MKNIKPRATTNNLLKKILGASAFIALAGATSVSVAGEFGNGVNLQPSYYNNGNVNMGWSLMKANTKIKSVRIEIEPGKETQGKTWIAQAKSNGYKVIATYHKSSVLGSDSASELATAGTWWKNNYSNLAAAGSIFVNVSNEWGSHNISSNAFASAYNTAISSVRSKYSGRIIVDIPGWGQETATAAAAIKGTNGTKINDTYIVPSIHAYPGAWNQGKNAWLAKSDVDDLGSAGRGVLIGEFGSLGSTGSSDWSGIVDYAKGKGYDVLGWAWNGDGGSMNMVTPSWSSNATATSFSKSSYFSVIYNKL